jgi:hypothetical protein
MIAKLAEIEQNAQRRQSEGKKSQGERRKNAQVEHKNHGKAARQ